MISPKPNWSFRFLRWFCHPDYVEDVEGDLEEIFQEKKDRMSLHKARWLLFFDVITLFRPEMIAKPHFTPASNRIAMLQNYLLTTFRSLRKSKLYTSVNTIGLAIGITAFMTIVIYISQELSYDRFFKDHERIYRATLKSYKNGELSDQNASNWIPLGSVAKTSLAEVEHSTRFFKSNIVLSKYVKFILEGENEIPINSEKLMGTDSSFFKVFSFHFIKGNPDDFIASNSLVLPASKADELFGLEWRNAVPGSSKDPIGKSIAVRPSSDIAENFTIVGIIDDIPENSHLIAEGIYHSSVFETPMHLVWGAAGAEFYTYIKVYPNTNLTTFQFKLNDLGKQYKQLTDQGYIQDFTLQPLADIYLDSNLRRELKPPGNRVVVYALFVVACLVLLLAWLNYINLTTVQSMERFKEVGLRKVIGARKIELIQQFLVSAFIVNAFSATISILLLIVALPFFNQYLGTNLELTIYQFGVPNTQLFWLLILVIYLLGAFISGIYPALALSSFNPVRALKGKLIPRMNWMGLSLRNGIMVFQFAISILLVAGTLTVLRQTNYMQSQSLGFDKEKMVVIENTFSNDTTFLDKMEYFKDQLAQQSFFTHVALSSSYPGQHTMSWHHAKVGTEDFKLFTLILVDHDFFDCYDIQLTAGRFFSKEFPSDRQNVIINEAGIQALGYASAEEAIQTKIKDQVHQRNVREIVGVAANHHHSSLHEEVEPIVYLLTDAEFYYNNTGSDQKASFNYNKEFITIKISQEKELSEAITTLQDTWKKSFANGDLHFFFLDDRYNQQYQSEVLFGKVFGMFSSLAILIASLGLIGFIAYSVRQRTKDIGIRKVLGASVANLWLTLSKDYIKLILIACVVALPIAYFLIQHWIDGFAYRTKLFWWLFAAPGVMVLVIALLSVSAQAIRAALANPVDSLRNE